LAFAPSSLILANNYLPLSGSIFLRKVLSAYAVKHIEKDYGPLVNLLPKFKKQPFSLTSKKAKAEDAATGKFIYVIEVLRHKSITSYKLGYKYKATEYFTAAGGALWEGTFKYKNAVKYGTASEGKYFEEPMLITAPQFIEWYKTETRGMAYIPDECIEILEEIFKKESASVRDIKI
jgi:hypothetical protein